jgi:hypothetical protein
MSERHVIIKLTPGKIYFNDKIFIEIEHSNLPQQLRTLNFDFVYWKLSQEGYDRSKGILSATVADYFPRSEDVALFCDQNPKYPVNNLRIQNLRDSGTLVAAVRYYQKQVIKSFQEDPDSYDVGTQIAIPIPKFVAASPPPGKRIIEKQYFINFRDAIFRTGYVCFEKFVEEAGRPVVFQIPNEYVLAEYEYIKSYFPKVLKIKKFQANAVIELFGQEVVNVTATSPHIGMIDQHLIDSIRISRTLALTKTPVYKSPDKSLFTSDEIFDTLESEDMEGNVFGQGEQDILSFLIDVKKVRNRKQLEYLAGKKQAAGEKLRFTLNPHFGFLFLLEGKTMNHFCWELLNSHATYIWSIDNEGMSMEMQYNRIELVINSIRNMGRDKYKSSYRNQHLDEDLVFCAIAHRDVNSDFVDGFVEWKHKLNEKIV